MYTDILYVNMYRCIHICMFFVYRCVCLYVCMHVCSAVKCMYMHACMHACIAFRCKCIYTCMWSNPICGIVRIVNGESADWEARAVIRKQRWHTKTAVRCCPILAPSPAHGRFRREKKYTDSGVLFWLVAEWDRRRRCWAAMRRSPSRTRYVYYCIASKPLSMWVSVVNAGRLCAAA